MSEIRIQSVAAREILDSRGNPTLAVEVATSDGGRGNAAVPSGASTGAREALELRDGDSARYGGKGVLKAVANVNGEVAQRMQGMLLEGLEEQTLLDRALNRPRRDGYEISVGSQCDAGRVPGGGACGCQCSRHSPLSLSWRRYSDAPPGTDDERPSTAEFMRTTMWTFRNSCCFPWGAPTFSEALRWGTEIFHTLKQVLHDKGHSTAVGDEGGFAPNLGSNQEAIELILQAIEHAGYRPGEEIFIALDPASSEFYQEGVYVLEGEGERKSSEEMIAFWQTWVSQYPVVSIEDGLAEDDWDGWKGLTSALGDQAQLVGDDLFVTNPSILQKGIEMGAANSILIKVNQIGTLTETLEAIEMAGGAGYSSVVSHRSGETEDTTIADLAVASGAGQIKTGSLCRTDRVCKYNRLLKIESELGGHAQYAGDTQLTGKKA